MHALTPRHLQRPRHHILLVIQNHLIRTRLPRPFRLLPRRRRPHDLARARALRELREEQPEPACDGVHEDGVPRFDAVRFFDEGERGEALEGGGGGGA